MVSTQRLYLSSIRILHLILGHIGHLTHQMALGYGSPLVSSEIRPSRTMLTCPAEAHTLAGRAQPESPPFTLLSGPGVARAPLN